MLQPAGRGQAPAIAAGAGGDRDTDAAESGGRADEPTAPLVLRFLPVGRPGRGALLPWALEGVALGAELLELGPGPGVTTEVLRRRVARLTAVELDAALAARLARRLPRPGVRVVRGDGAALPFRDRSFEAAAVFTMLHHVPSVALQDRLLAEVCRCLRPGGLLVGSDTLPSLRFRLYHLADTMVVVDPDRL